MRACLYEECVKQGWGLESMCKTLFTVFDLIVSASAWYHRDEHTPHTHHVQQKQRKQILMWPCWFWMVSQALPKPNTHTLTFALQIHISCSVVKRTRDNHYERGWEVITVLGEGVTIYSIYHYHNNNTDFKSSSDMRNQHHTHNDTSC